VIRKRSRVNAPSSTNGPKADFFQESIQRDDGERFTVRADEKLTAFLELKSEISQAKSSILRESP
jgi:hypothetical protein